MVIYGTNYSDILAVFREFGFDMPLTKSMRDDKKIVENAAAYNKLLEQTVDTVPINDVIAGYGVAEAADEAYMLLMGARKISKEGISTDGSFDGNNIWTCDRYVRGSKGQKADVVIQGMGRVGSACANRLMQLGHRVVGMSDSKVFLYNPNGLDTQIVHKLKKEGKAFKSGDFGDGTKIMQSCEWLSVPCDIIVPCALADALNGDNAGYVKAALVVEGANIATSAAADEVFKKKGDVYDMRAYSGRTRSLSEAWMYDAVFFGTVEAEKDVVLAAAAELCRREMRGSRCSLLLLRADMRARA